MYISLHQINIRKKVVLIFVESVLDFQALWVFFGFIFVALHLQRLFWKQCFLISAKKLQKHILQKFILQQINVCENKYLYFVFVYIKCILRTAALTNSIHSNESKLEKFHLANSKIHESASTTFFRSKCNAMTRSSIFSFCFYFLVLLKLEKRQIIV